MNNDFNLNNIILEKDIEESKKIIKNSIKIKVQWESVEDEDERLGELLKNLQTNEKKQIISNLVEESDKYKNADINVSLLLFRNGIIENTDDLIYYNSQNLENKIWLFSESIRNQENLEKLYNSDYKSINFQLLNNLEKNVNKIAIIISIYINNKDILKRNFTTFSCVKNLRVRISDNEISSNDTYFYSNLNEDNGLSTVLLLGEFIKIDKEKWEFKEINKGYITDRKKIKNEETGEIEEVKSVATIITVVNDYLEQQNKKK